MIDEILAAKIYTQARLMATDEDLCKVCGITPEQLDDYRAVIEEARTAALVSLRFERARGKVRKAAKP